MLGKRVWEQLIFKFFWGKAPDPRSGEPTARMSGASPLQSLARPPPAKIPGSAPASYILWLQGSFVGGTRLLSTWYRHCAAILKKCTVDIVKKNRLRSHPLQGVAKYEVATRAELEPMMSIRNHGRIELKNLTKKRFDRKTWSCVSAITW